MKKLLPVLLAGLSGLSLALSGCEDTYAPDLKYGVRTDPVLLKPGSTLGDERYDPDRPGQLPLLALKDLDDTRNPLHERRDKILAEKVFRDPAALTKDDRRKLEAVLEELFGRPADPKVDGVSESQQAVLQLEPQRLQDGGRHYRIHCVHCHGVPGDGRGPTARWVNPHPRDFRLGLFKFQSVDQATSGKTMPPRRVDLLRTVEHGLEGSAMPAFTLLSKEEREAVVSYVIHLSLRGSAELETIKNAFELDAKSGELKPVTDDDTGGPTDIGQYVRDMHKKNLGRWARSQEPDMAIKVAAYPYKDDDSEEAREQMKQSVLRGQQLFTGVAEAGADAKFRGLVDKAKCVSCHTDYGRQAQFRWDEWGTLVRPNNFTQGVFRGGRRPVDFYYRIHSGINGSGMSNFGSTLPADSIWDLVNFVRTMPYPLMRDRLGVALYKSE